MKSYYQYPIEHTLGSVLGYVPKGKDFKSDLVVGSPYIRIKNKSQYLGYSSFSTILQKAQGGSLQFLAVAHYKGDKWEKAEVTTLYQLNPESGNIDITSTVKNTGSVRLEDFHYSLKNNSGQVYSFSPFDYADRLPFWVYPKKGHYLGWIDLNPIRSSSQPISRESISMNLDPGKSFEARYVLLVDVEAENLLKKIYQILGVRTAKVNIDTTLLQDPPKGKVKISIRNKTGAFVPGKTTFFGLDPTRTPYFRPENPLETNNAHEYFKNSCYPQEEGLEVDLPVGTYMISASRGPEYTLDQRVVEILKDSLQEVVFRIDKIIETTNLISVDPHMHTLNSDGSMTIAERIKSAVAEGVDVAISADHNYISDYPSELKKIGLGEFIAVLIGQEVTPLDVNQVYMPEFNRFPLKVRESEPGNGAIDIRFFEDNTPIIAESRRRDPGALIQVNHPRRRGYGYFTYYQLDPETDVGIKIQSAPWISVDEVRIIINGERKIIFPIKVPREQILKFQNRISLNLKTDSYVAIEALGNKTLYPVVQKRLRNEGYERGPLPYALTNPIFVDVDGNGKFDSPLPKINLSGESD
ncbi:MAG: PHP domain-containing protein [Candidatus Aminicenantes bacterium]|nr:PHP domain-containing protein [Candidatus Aminicenantes bacterium]